MSVGTLGPGGGGYARTAAEIEDQIAAAAGGVELPRGSVPMYPPAPARADSRPIIAGVNVVTGTAITAWGEIALDPMALSIIVGLVSTAVRDHIQAQLNGLNAQLGLPNATAIAGVAAGAVTRAAAGGPPPLPSENGTGHSEGEDAP